MRTLLCWDREGLKRLRVTKSELASMFRPKELDRLTDGKVVRKGKLRTAIAERRAYLLKAA